MKMAFSDECETHRRRKTDNDCIFIVVLESTIHEHDSTTFKDKDTFPEV